MLALKSRRRPGNVVVAVAVSLVTLLACVALAVDGGMLMDKRRHVQAAADAAALAAAGDLYYNWPVDKGADRGSAYRAAVNTAGENGFTDGADGPVVVNLPPKTGPFAGVKGYVEVVITYNHPRFFSRVMGTEAIPVRARAVARGSKTSSKQAILVLDPNDKGALNVGGGGTITVTGSPIQVNSDHAEAAIANGGGTMSSLELDITGGFSTPGGGSFAGPISTGTEPIPDPLAFLPPPDPTGMVVRSRNNTHYSSGNRTLQPGVYVGGISIGGKASVTLEPGIYYMKGGGFSFSGQGSLVGHGVMIYNDPESTSDKISLSGTNAVRVDLTPPTSGPYQGILFWQKRGADVPIDITGNGNLNVTGTFYATGATLKVAGNGAADLIGSQYIVDSLVTTGNGNFSVNWTPEATPGIREICLVE